RPERAWRAFSQWRASLLSRGGGFSPPTLFPPALFWVGWGVFHTTPGFVGFFGVFSAPLPAPAIAFTRMIYASLKPIHQWHNRWVVPNYLALALMSGFLVLDFLIRPWAPSSSGTALLSIIIVLVAWRMKEQYWLAIDSTSAPSTVSSATLLVT